jgi:hypothetical protein
MPGYLEKTYQFRIIISTIQVLKSTRDYLTTDLNFLSNPAVEHSDIPILNSSEADFGLD